MSQHRMDRNDRTVIWWRTLISKRIMTGVTSMPEMTMDTGRVRRLTSGKGPDFRTLWSPDDKWISFSSCHDHPAPFAHGRLERLQLADLYIIHPDQSGLKKVTSQRGFCGSQKWMPDSRHLVAYCTDAENTHVSRLPIPAPDHDTKLVSFDIHTRASVDLAAGPGVKINRSPLPGNDVGYVRKDKEDPGGDIYYVSGTRGPRGDIRNASWSPTANKSSFTSASRELYPRLKKPSQRIQITK